MHPEPVHPAPDARIAPDARVAPAAPTGDARIAPAAPTGDARVAPAAPTGDARIDPAAPTGDARVDAAIAGLIALDDTDLADRPAVLETVHDRLREILGELGDAGRPAHSGQVHGHGHSGQGGPSGDPRR